MKMRFKFPKEGRSTDMNKNSSFFSQMLALIQRWEFENLVRQTGAEYAAWGFSNREHFVAILFRQRGQAHSLREICNGLARCFGKQNLRIRTAVETSTNALKIINIDSGD